MSSCPAAKYEIYKSRIPVPIYYSTLHKKENKPSNIPKKAIACIVKEASENNSNRPSKCEKILKTNVTDSKSVRINKIAEKPLQNGKLHAKPVQKRIENQTATKIFPNVLKHETLAAKSKCLKKSAAEKQYNIKSVKSTETNKNLKFRPMPTAVGIQIKSVKSTETNTNLKARLMHTAVDIKSAKNIKETALKNMSEVGVKNERNTLVYLPKPKLHNDNKINDDEPKALYNLNQKENKLPLKPSILDSQKDIKFEANEMFRRMILSERAFSPNQPGLRFSSFSCERPSIYARKKLEIPADPLQALKDACLSLKRDRKVSLVKQAIEKNPVCLSPCSDRYSFYSPCTDPKREVMKSLEAMKARLKLKNTVKSSKKVSFNLNVEAWSPKEKINMHETPFKPSELKCGLTKINERSEENTPDSPPSNINEQNSSVKPDVNNLQPLDRDNKPTISLVEQIAASTHEQNSVNKVDFEEYKNSNLCTPIAKLLPISRDMHRESITANFVNTTNQITDSMLHSLRKLDSKFLPSNSNCGDNIVYDAKKSFRDDDGNRDRATETKLFTPRPISFFSKSSSVDVSSPEFLSGVDNHFLADFAPISTPFVLRSLAKSSMRSPEENLSPLKIFPLKLDFTEEDKDSPKKEGPTKNYNLSLEKIATHQKMMDSMADKECGLWLRNERISIICGRYLQNPVALTLTEGDDMHFIPIKF